MDQETDSTKQRALRKLERDIGPSVIDALHDPKTVELMCNQDGKLWVEKLGQPMREMGSLRPAQVESIIRTVAGFHDKVVSRANPLLEGEWPLDGSRFAGQLPPVVPAGTFAIRKKAVAVFTLKQYLETGVMTQEQYDRILWAILEHKNIVVNGGTGSGKTTLINAVIDGVVKTYPHERIFIIEDTGEIQCSADNFVQYHTTLDVDMTQLLKTSLRMRPDRILVGEVRGAEALDLLDAWNTGHPGGMATIHANSAIEALTRLKSLVSRNRAAPKEIEPLIAEAVDMVVCIKKDPSTPAGRCISEIIEVTGFENNAFRTQQL
jgi:P-type conjugative transfer ATPase TrbB